MYYPFPPLIPLTFASLYTEKILLLPHPAMVPYVCCTPSLLHYSNLARPLSLPTYIIMIPYYLINYQLPSRQLRFIQVPTSLNTAKVYTTTNYF